MGVSNRYHFVTRWTVEATAEEVYDVIHDAPALARWWPSVYLAVEQLSAGDEWGIGAEHALHTKGFLPYTLRWQFRLTEAERPRRIALAARGDFVGRGIWTFNPAPGGVDVEFDWELLAEKPILRTLSFLMKPIFAANHRWAMDRGLESLRLELQRRRATSDAARAGVPPPPPATFPHRRRTVG